MDGHEAEYLKAVERKLRDVPRRQRRELLGLTTTVLEERPTSSSAEELGEALGYPWQHAERLREEHGIPAHVPWLVRVASASRRAHVAMVVVPVFIAVAAFSTWSWWTADPGIHNSCSGVHAGLGVTTELREAGGASEHLIGYLDGAEVGLFLCLSARDAIVVQRVAVGGAPLSLFDDTTFQASSFASGPDYQGGRTAGRGEHFTIDPHGEPWERQWNVDVIGRLTDCEWYVPGGGNQFDVALVTYRYRGRTRRATVDLNTTYTFTSPPTADCPRPAEYG
jgi:hypothetical protein